MQVLLPQPGKKRAGNCSSAENSHGGEEGRGEQLAQQQGQTFVLATPTKSSSKQKDKKTKEAGLFLKQDLIITVKLLRFPGSGRNANMT